MSAQGLPRFAALLTEVDSIFDMLGNVDIAGDDPRVRHRASKMRDDAEEGREVEDVEDEEPHPCEIEV